MTEVPTRCIRTAQFCYVCGIPWKNCECAQYTANFGDDILGAENPGARRAIYERRTIFRTDKALDRYHKHLKQTWGAPNPRPREEQLAEVREAIENGCDHGYWTRVETRGHCKMCKYVGWRFIFQCINCDLTSCWACHTDEPPEYRRVLDETEV